MNTEIAKLQEFITLDQIVKKSEVQNQFSKVSDSLKARKIMFVVEKKEPTMVLLSPSEYLEMLERVEHAEKLQDFYEINKARTGKYHSEDVIDNMFKAAGYSGLK